MSKVCFCTGLLITGLSVGILEGAPPAGRSQGPSDRLSVVMLIGGRDFAFDEFRPVHDYFVRHGVDVAIASAETAEVAAINDSLVRPELLTREVDPAEYQAVVLIGGVGATRLWNDTTTWRLLRAFLEQPDRLTGAIGLGPVVLAKANLISGRTLTVYNDVRAIRLLKEAGARYRTSDVVTDRNLITASSPEAALKFARTVERWLKRKYR